MISAKRVVTKICLYFKQSTSIQRWAQPLDSISFVFWTVLHMLKFFYFFQCYAWRKEMLSHLSPAPLGVGWAYFLPLSTQTWENLMSVIKLRSRGMLGQRKADLGLKAAQRKKTTHTDIFDSSKIPNGCDSQNPPTNTWKIPRMISEVSTWWVVYTLQLCIVQGLSSPQANSECDPWLRTFVVKGHEGVRPVQPPQRLARKAPARRRQLHTVAVARRRRRKEELQGHLSGAHTWDGRWDIRWENPLY
jgi:hypothetical protein